MQTIMRWMEYSYTSGSLRKLVVPEWNIQITTLKGKNNLKWVIWKEKILWNKIHVPNKSEENRSSITFVFSLCLYNT